MDFFLHNRASRTVFKVLNIRVSTLIKETKSLMKEVDFAS